MRRVILIALFATLLLVAPAVAAAKLPGVLTGDRSVVRPSIIDYTGDASAIVGGRDGSGINHPGHLKWTTYNERQGIATGTIWIDNCLPNCAQGRFTGSRVKVNAYSPSGGHFRRVKLTYNYRGHHQSTSSSSSASRVRAARSTSTRSGSATPPANRVAAGRRPRSDMRSRQSRRAT